MLLAEKHDCSFCGESKRAKAGFLTKSGELVAIRKSCALDELPSLMADSVFLKKQDPMFGLERQNRKTPWDYWNYWNLAKSAFFSPYWGMPMTVVDTKNMEMLGYPRITRKNSIKVRS